MLWPHGQAVKTPPFHGGIRGSIPLEATKKIERRNLFAFLLLYLLKGIEPRLVRPPENLSEEIIFAFLFVYIYLK